MTDLHAAAQAVIDVWFRPHGINYVDLMPYMEALRQALAEPDKRKPVAWQVQTEHYGVGYSFDEEFLEAFPKFTPPSVDALIAEIDGLHRYNFFNNGVLVFDEVEVEAILDKYRSVK